METIKCKMCGSTVLDKEGDFFVCHYCGTKHKEENNSLIKIDGIATYESEMLRGETFLKLGEYQKAYNVFSSLAEKYPYKNKIYENLIIIQTYNFSAINSDILFQIEEYERRLCILNNGEIHSDFFIKLNRYKQLVKNVSHNTDDLSAVQKKLDKLTLHVKEVTETNETLTSYIENFWTIIDPLYKRLMNIKLLKKTKIYKKNNNRFINYLCIACFNNFYY